MKKKWISTILAVVMALGLTSGLAACGGAKSDPTKLKVTFMSKHEYTKEISELAFVDELEQKFTDKTGMTIDWNIIPIGDSETKGLQITTEKNIPDVFIGESYSDSVILQNESLFVELTDSITAERLPNVKAMFDEVLRDDGVDFRKEAALYNGKIYGIPRVAPFSSDNVTFFMVNNAWIRAINETFDLGLLDPTPTVDGQGKTVYPTVTIADFDAWLKAFKTQRYYDGAIYKKTYSWYHDGAKALTDVPYSQSIALDLNGEGDLYNYLTAFGNSALGEAGVNDGLKGNTDDLFIRQKDGATTVSYKYTNVEVKYMAEYFRGLYRDGVLNNQFITQTFTTMMGNSRNASGSKVGCATGWSLADKYGPNADQYTVFRPLTGNASFMTGDAANLDPSLSDSGYGLKYAYNRYLVTRKAEKSGKLDAALDLLEIFYDPIMSMKTFYGSSDDCFHAYTGDAVNEAGERYQYEFTVPEGQFYDVWKWKNGFADYGLGYAPKSLQDVTLLPAEHKERLDISRDLYKPYIVESGEYMPLNMKFDEDEQEFLDEYFSYLNQLGSTAVSQYINGTNKSAEWWNALQNDLTKYGVDELEQLYLDKYNAYFQ